jgi:hypothetical protein
MKHSKSTTFGIWGPDGQSLLPVYVGKRGAPKGNRNAERDGRYNREAKASGAKRRVILKGARAAMLDAKLFLAEMRAARVLTQMRPITCPDTSPNSN